METIAIEELHEEGPQERMEEYMESIPDGEAVKLRQAVRDTGLTSRSAWEDVAGDRFLKRFYQERQVFFLVNSRTAKKLAAKGE